MTASPAAIARCVTSAVARCAPSCTLPERARAPSCPACEISSSYKRASVIERERQASQLVADCDKAKFPAGITNFRRFAQPATLARNTRCLDMGRQKLPAPAPTTSPSTSSSAAPTRGSLNWGRCRARSTTRPLWRPGAVRPAEGGAESREERADRPVHRLVVQRDRQVGHQHARALPAPPRNQRGGPGEYDFDHLYRAGATATSPGGFRRRRRRSGRRRRSAATCASRAARRRPLRPEAAVRRRRRRHERRQRAGEEVGGLRVDDEVARSSPARSTSAPTSAPARTMPRRTRR